MTDSLNMDSPNAEPARAQRIVFVAPFGLGQKTTVWARTLPLAHQLVVHGSAVTIVIPPWDTPADSGRCWVDDGVQIINVTLDGGMPLVVWHMLSTIDRLQPDIVHIVKPRAHAGLIQWLLWQRRRLLGRLLGHRPHIFLDVDDWEQAWAPINHYPPLVARFLAWQEEWGIRHADGISAASHWLVDRVQQYTPKTPVCYLPNGISAPSHVMTAAPSGQQILFYSRYVEVAPEWLADFWSALQQQLPNATLVVFGNALQSARTAQFQQVMAERVPVSTRSVQWLPYDPNVVERLYNESACAIFPSERTPLHEAKCSVRLATTLLRGIPVVASAVGEQQYYGAEGAAMLVPGEAAPEEFAATVCRVLADPQAQLHQQNGATARLLRDYDWGNLGQGLADFYRRGTWS